MGKIEDGTFRTEEFVLADQKQEPSKYINLSLEEIISALEISSFSLEQLFESIRAIYPEEKLDKQDGTDWKRVEFLVNKVGAEELRNELGKTADMDEIYKLKAALGGKIWEEQGIGE